MRSSLAVTLEQVSLKPQLDTDTNLKHDLMFVCKFMEAK